MKWNNLINIVSVIVFVLGISSNLYYAINDYDIVKNTLHIEVLAQSSSSSGDGGTTGGSFKYSTDKKDCLYRGMATPYAVVKLGPDAVAFADYEGRWEYKEMYGNVKCISGGSNPCTPKECPDYEGRTT